MNKRFKKYANFETFASLEKKENNLKLAYIFRCIISHYLHFNRFYLFSYDDYIESDYIKT